ncbi:LuxR family transcriptional regulator [Natronospirillum operosum]|uniref:LuxR family transcriptional regulator n=1 Tax=Natronospirillum operosum TaxID=2759953 RepID=A0A4Z0W589_9GAMM|nr:helix-turn-helix transcriptional regulator [Natronospirillum operosum]TGG92027.1 LuxR family transcriptional regulator [Natronospirillum operosum]
MNGPNSDSGLAGQLLLKLYDSAIEADAWPDVLATLAQYLNVGSVSLRLVGLDKPVVHLSHSHGFTKDLYPQYVVKDPFRNALLSNPVGHALRSQDFLTDEDYAQTDHHRYFFGPQNRFYAMGSLLMVQGDQALHLGVHRSRETGGFFESDRRALHDLIPHVQQAVRLQRMLGQMTAALDRTLKALDHFPIGIAFVASDGYLQWANAAARTLMHERRFGFSVSSSRIRFNTPRVQDRSAFWDFVAAGEGELKLPLDGNGSHLLAVAQQRRVGTQVIVDEGGVALFFVDPQRPVGVDCATLNRQYGLTPAEARLTEQLLKGLDLREAAEALHVSVHTVRSQLKSVQQKTGCRRQAELIKTLVLGGDLVRPHAGEEVAFPGHWGFPES